MVSLPKCPVSCPKFTPLVLQIMSIGTCLLTLICTCLTFAFTFNPARLATSIFVLGMAATIIVADIRAFAIFAYMKFLYTAVGRGLTFVLIGCLMITSSLLALIPGVLVVALGVVYAITAWSWGGVPKPIMQRSTEDIPLNANLRFVTFDQRNISTSPSEIV